MDNIKKIKISLGTAYIIILSVFLWVLFSNFSIKDFSSYEIIKSNTDILNNIKDNNLIFLSLGFFLFTVVWVLLLGFGSPILLIGGFIFGKWIGTVIVIFSLSIGCTILYIFASYLFKNIIEKKFSSKFSYLINKFKKNEFLYFVIFRAIGGIPFFIQNLIPIIFNISLKNYFFGSLIGMTPQIFIGVSLGAGINILIKSNSEVPSFFDMIFMPDIFIPVIGLILIFLIGFISRKKFFKE